MSISEVFDQKLILSLSKVNKLGIIRLCSLSSIGRCIFRMNHNMRIGRKIRKRHAFLLISSATDFLATLYILHMYYEKRLQPSDAAVNEESNGVL